MSLILGAPLRGVLHPEEWANYGRNRPAGNLDFRVTQKFGCTGAAGEPPLGACPGFHRGIDLGNGHRGADVLAVGRGTVKYAGTVTGTPRWGEPLAVVLNLGDGAYFISGHLDDLAVKTGQVVNLGQRLGPLGSTGAEFPHLHGGLKVDVPAGTSINGVFSDKVGRWADPWPHIAQNVTARPRGAAVNIRTSAGSGSTPGPVHSTTKADGRIHRASDGKDLGETALMRKWGGVVTGSSYVVDGKAGNHWERIWLDGAYRFVASPLAVRSI